MSGSTAQAAASASVICHGTDIKKVNLLKMKAMNEVMKESLDAGWG